MVLFVANILPHTPKKFLYFLELEQEEQEKQEKQEKQEEQEFLFLLSFLSLLSLLSLLPPPLVLALPLFTGIFFNTRARKSYLNFQFSILNCQF